MASIINASATGVGGVVTTADASGVLNIQSNGVTMASVSSSGFNLGSGTPSISTALSPFTGFKNRIINGAMQIDQRNAGTSGTANGYTVDRWNFTGTQSSKGTWQQNAGSVTPPVGFTNYLGFTSSSAYSVLTGDTFLFNQPIEGLNVADLGWGTANAQTVTISFWVRSSLTGTFGGALSNGAGTRGYPFNYTISAANTWEQKTITIAGDTTGTWLTTNATGVFVRFGLGSGATFSGTAGTWAAGNIVQPTSTVSVVSTNGATWYVTGVQLEVGTQATSFEYRDYGRELMMCQRYYFKSQSFSSLVFNGSGSYSSYQFKVSMRTAPTVTAAYAANSVDIDGFYAQSGGVTGSTGTASAEL